MSCGAAAGQRAMPSLFEIAIEDDGPGIPEDKAREALKRGRRLDETKPGTGLGLAIVADLVNEYGGKLALERSGIGGLKAHRSNCVASIRWGEPCRLWIGPNFGQISTLPRTRS